jgi:hypothetical protein
MGFACACACAGAADEHDVALLDDEAADGEIIDERLGSP